MSSEITHSAEGHNNVGNERNVAGLTGKNPRKLLNPLRPLAAVGVTYVIHAYVPSVVVTQSADPLLVLLLLLATGGLANLTSFVLWRKRIPSVERAIVLAAVLILTWDVVVAKLGLLTPPFFPTPEKVLQVYGSDYWLLLASVGHSLRILLSGWLLGAIIGTVIGFLVGWYGSFRMWSLPLLRLFGPIPATALTALAIAVFPGLLGSVFLVAFAVVFPVFMNSWSGVANVRKSLIETAQTLGASEFHVIRRVVFPSAMPSIFTGLFIGLLTSFLTVIAAEMLGVERGLGWYIWRAQGWAEYYRVYAAVIVMGFLFSSLLTTLFLVRDRLLRWEKGVIKW